MPIHSGVSRDTWGPRTARAWGWHCASSIDSARRLQGPAATKSTAADIRAAFSIFLGAKGIAAIVRGSPPRA
ncbi:hypothetical protein CLJ1_1542 [Pseudomonas paraeruginosa]|nr:hypothetical protein CLJ1_1542 [Pseudomonas aeruginosa]